MEHTCHITFETNVTLSASRSTSPSHKNVYLITIRADILPRARVNKNEKKKEKNKQKKSSARIPVKFVKREPRLQFYSSKRQNKWTQRSRRDVIKFKIAISGYLANRFCRRYALPRRFVALTIGMVARARACVINFYDRICDFRAATHLFYMRNAPGSKNNPPTVNSPS